MFKPLQFEYNVNEVKELKKQEFSIDTNLNSTRLSTMAV